MPIAAVIASGVQALKEASVDIYHAWCDLKPGVKDTDFAENVAAYMGHLKEQGLIEILAADASQARL